MELHAEKVGFWSRDLLAVNNLYNEAFPRSERVSMPLLLSLAKRGCADFYALYDDLTLAGITYLVYGEGMVYVFYLAINAAVRSHGYGSAILDWVKGQHPGEQLVLEIETVGTGFDNDEQRVSRQKFYFKNGFRDTGYRMAEGEDVYDVLCTAGDFYPEGLITLLKRYSLGFGDFQMCDSEAAHAQ